MRLLSFLFCCILFGSSCCAQTTSLDACDDVAPWSVVTADGVTLTLRTEPTDSGHCLRLDYHFVTGAGYALIHRDLPLDLPANYELAFQVRGEGPSNNLECKLLDEKGDSVWWINRRNFEWPTTWRRLVNKRRHFEFAWGPSNGAPLTRTSALEFAIASSTGGKGTVWLDDITFRELPPPSTDPLPTPTTATQENDILLDLGAVREFGGVDVTWSTLPESVLAESSDDAKAWSPLAPRRKLVGERTLFVTPNAEARYVRLRTEPGVSPDWKEPPPPAKLATVKFRPYEFSATPNAVITTLAHESPRGVYPRQFLGEQSYWTVVGAEDDSAEALLNEEGQLELWKRGASIEPFILMDDKLLTWADGSHTQSLIDSALPLPTVRRTHADCTLDISPWSEKIDGVTWLFASYTLKNTTTHEISPSLMLAVRPYQVNPPWQRLNFEGGVSPIRIATDYERSSIGIAIENAGSRRMISMQQTPESILDEPFDAGDIMTRIHAAPTKYTKRERQPPGDLTPLLMLPVAPADNESAAITFDTWMKPADIWTFTIATSMHEAADIPEGFDFAASRERTIARWRDKLSNVRLHVPRDSQWIADTFTTQLGAILVNRDGPAIQPGSRSYERSWARDGSMTTAALLECGYTQEARAWIDWFSQHIFDSGKVPCVVDARGPDPVPEHDSHGQYIWAVMNYYAHTKDLSFAQEHWPRVQRVVEYIKSIRAQRMTPEFADTSSPKHVFYGLVPESISHEGYSAKPMHSYWDDFFVLLGLKEAARLAKVVGDQSRAQEYDALAADFRSTFAASMKLAMQQHNINYAPGCAELGDFDATSTTIALFPCNEPDVPPPGAMNATFDKYWRFVDDRTRSTTWDAYTPYEVRAVGAFIRLGERDRAHALLNWLRTHQRPQAWNHWAEVVWRDPLTPKFIGDMPHTWVGSDFLNSVRAIFLIDNPDSITLFAGVPASWLRTTDPVGFDGFVTPWGTLAATMQRSNDQLHISITGLTTIPPEGLAIAPLPGFETPTTPIRTLPAELTLRVMESEPTHAIPK
jgi:hypothetical protein